MPVLGSGHSTAYVYDRQGQTRLLTLPRASSITYGRALSQVSTASVTIEAQNCTPELDKVHAWAHNLVIYRNDGQGGNGRRVWEGPIKLIPASRNQLRVEAVDVIGHGQRRLIRAARKLLGSPARTELAWSVEQMFTPDDPNVLPFLQITGTVGPNIDRDVARYSAFHSDDLGTITGGGGAFTVLGRRIILFSDTDTLGRTETLVPEDHLESEVEVVEDGDALFTWAAARDDNGTTGVYGITPDGVDPYYGRVDGLVSSGPGASTAAALTARAQTAVRRAYPARQIIRVPDGAQLRCDAPFPLEALVPGTLVPVVTTTATGRTIRASMILSAVSVTQTPGGDEAVTMTLIPMPSEV